jgi:outer membrane protein assembly factor BamB
LAVTGATNSFSERLLSGGLVYLTTTDGQLVVLEETTGAERYVLELGLPFISSPAISGNAIFLASYNGALLALVSTAKGP